MTSLSSFSRAWTIYRFADRDVTNAAVKRLLVRLVAAVEHSADD